MTPSRETADQGTGDLSAAIEAMTVRWAGLIQAAAVRYGLQGFERDDMMQRVRLRLWRTLEKHGSEREINAGYGYQAAVSAAIDVVRERRAGRSSHQVPFEAIDGSVAAKSEGLSESALLAALDNALSRLDPPRRVAVRLHLSGHHLRDIATMAGWTEAKARNLLYRGLDDLRGALAGKE